jgi:cellulose synthase/poly-beta-1,6-N-acetylglucosamine synthase-like glycosyltransferase
VLRFSIKTILWRESTKRSRVNQYKAICGDQYLREKLPYVSIIVIVLNMKDTIGRCLHSLETIDYPQNKREIVVVDGGSVDGTQEKTRVC